MDYKKFCVKIADATNEPISTVQKIVTAGLNQLAELSNKDELHFKDPKGKSGPKFDPAWQFFYDQMYSRKKALRKSKSRKAREGK